MQYIDIHSHLNLSQFQDDHQEVIAELEKRGVATITVGIDEKSSRRAVELAHSSDNLFACIGLHPSETDRELFNPAFYADLVKDPRVVCVGECGLDYFRMETSDTGLKDRQKAQFRAQIEFALSYDKPLMLHIRPSQGSFDAYHDTLEILKEYKALHGDRLRGDAHFFAGNTEVALDFIALGFYISFTGVITFTHDYDEVVRAVPIEYILSETDAPYVAPVPFRGKRAEPWHVISVVQRLAELKGLSSEEMSRQILTNAKRLFDIGHIS